MNFSNEQEYKAYFEALAVSHVDIENFVFGDSKEFSKVQKSGTNTGIALWLDYYPPIRGAADHDNPLGRLTAEWVVMKAASNRHHNTAELQAILKQCEDIAQQIFAKIFYDFQMAEGFINEPEFSSLQFGRMETHTFGSTTYEGTACQIDFLIPLATEFNTEKWQ